MADESKRSIEKTGRTVEEAVAAALAELGVGREQVEVEVLGPEARPFLGIFGAQQTRVRVTLTETIAARACSLVERILAAMGISAAVAVTSEEEETVCLEVSGADDLGVIIGKHGQVLAALQHLVGLIANRHQAERRRVLIDVEGYRGRREKALKNLALGTARKAKQSGKEATIAALPAHERRIVHITLRDDPEVSTRSVGEEPHRKIIVSPTRRGGGESRQDRSQ
jgi:spoIIIJ-associated protein